MPSPWQVIVVRAWRLGHRRVIRLTVSLRPGAPACTHYVTSGRAAAELLRRLLDDPQDPLEGSLEDDGRAVAGEPQQTDDAS